MARFFFDIDEDGRRSPDDFGEELDGFGDAREHAQAILADLLRELLPNGERMVCACEVRDERGVILYRGRLSYDGRGLDS